MIGLTINNLVFSYNGKPVLKDISIEVKSGEFIGLVGPNGSGKTTLLKCITGVLSPQKGAVHLGGKNLKNLKSPEIARNVAVVPQGGSVDFDFSVKDIVLMGRHPHQGRFTISTKNDEKIVTDCLKITRTSEFENKSIMKLSGGEFQRVLIARSLAQQPKLLLLDEPTSHLDISHQLEIMDIMKNQNTKKKITIIGVFHDLNLASRYCKRLILLNKGEITADGSLESVLTTGNLRKVFKINALVRKNPVTGSLYIDPIDTTLTSADKIGDLESESSKLDVTDNDKAAMDSREGVTNIHIICGGGTGSEIMEVLTKYNYNISAGVLNVLDQDHVTANELEIPVISEAAFSPISNISHEKNLQFISRADIVILTDVPIGTANFKNLQAVSEAIKKGKQVILFEPDKNKDFSDRDFTNGKAVELFKFISTRADLFISITGILDFLKERKKSRN